MKDVFKKMINVAAVAIVGNQVLVGMFGINVFSRAKDLIMGTEELPSRLGRGFSKIEEGTIVSNEEIKEEKTVITTVEVESKFNTISELATASEEYSAIVLYEDDRTVGFVTVPFSKSTMQISFSGVVKAGFDLSEFTFEVDEDKIYVYMPKTTILSHEFGDIEEIYDEGFMNRISPEVECELVEDKAKEEERRIVKGGIYDLAEDNAKEVIRDVFSEFEELGYTVEFIDYVKAAPKDISMFF
ncbi:MAG: DUF4230 domain-containing protein [Clostridia bacterium]|nr:DUF4230 domain-containing protein [Clostridia bacterium]